MKESFGCGGDMVWLHIRLIVLTCLKKSVITKWTDWMVDRICHLMKDCVCASVCVLVRDPELVYSISLSVLSCVKISLDSRCTSWCTNGLYALPVTATSANSKVCRYFVQPDNFISSSHPLCWKFFLSTLRHRHYHLAFGGLRSLLRGWNEVHATHKVP